MFKFPSEPKKKSTRTLNQANCPAGFWYAYDGDISKEGVNNRVFYIKEWFNNHATVIMIVSYGEDPFTVSAATWQGNDNLDITYSKVNVDLSNVVVSLAE